MISMLPKTISQRNKLVNTITSTKFAKYSHDLIIKPPGTHPEGFMFVQKNVALKQNKLVLSG